MEALRGDALLGATVVCDETRGGRCHPKLERFRAQASPLGCVTECLWVADAELRERGDPREAGRIAPKRTVERIVARGQTGLAWGHVQAKLDALVSHWRESVESASMELLDSLFCSVAGGASDRERMAH